MPENSFHTVPYGTGSSASLPTKRGTKNNKWRTMIYKCEVGAVLLFGAEAWVLSKAMETKLQSFHHRCARASNCRTVHNEEPGQYVDLSANRQNPERSRVMHNPRIHLKTTRRCKTVRSKSSDLQKMQDIQSFG